MVPSNDESIIAAYVKTRDTVAPAENYISFFEHVTVCVHQFSAIPLVATAPPDSYYPERSEQYTTLAY